MIEKITIDGKVYRPSGKLKISKVLYIPRVILEKARISSVSYNDMKAPS